MRLNNWDNLPQSSADIARKFDQSYLRAIVPELGSVPKVIQLSRIDGDYGRASYLNDAGKEATVTILWGGLEVVESWPSVVGSIQFFNKVLLLKRNPARQWMVGLSHGNAMVWDHTLNSLGQRWGLPEATALYLAAYENVDLTTVVKRFEENPKLEAFALNPIYWLSRQSDKLVLHRNQIPLGSFVYGKFFLNSRCTDFRQELWDDLHLRVT